MAVPAAILGTIALDRRTTVPLQTQLYRALRDAVLDGRLRAGVRLPATRVVARDLRVARNTVVAVFEQLVAEGYLEARVGSGTRVATIRSNTVLRPSPRGRHAPIVTRSALSRRGTMLAALRRSGPGPTPRAFQVGLPALDLFPTELWARLLARRARTPATGALGYDHSAGFPPLREAIVDYLGAARGVVCESDQVIVVAGAQAGLALACHALLDPGDQVWLEDPGYLGARGALFAASADVVPVPVDDEGLDVATGTRTAPRARLAYASPSYQLPLGITMSLARRLTLLDWAARTGAWILEDDYDSEYRYGGRPLAAMQGIDQAGRVIYVGTFSKTMFAALRVGYLIVPRELAEPFAVAMRQTGHSAPVAIQAALADFLAEGHYAAHVRRMRRVYADRQAALLSEARARLAGLLELAPAEAGMQLLGRLPPGVDDVGVCRDAAGHGLSLRPLSVHYLGRPRGSGILLGYAGVPEREMPEAVERLAGVLRRSSRPAPGRGVGSHR